MDIVFIPIHFVNITFPSKLFSNINEKRREVRSKWRKDGRKIYKNSKNHKIYEKPEQQQTGPSLKIIKTNKIYSQHKKHKP